MTNCDYHVNNFLRLFALPLLLPLSKIGQMKIASTSDLIQWLTEKTGIIIYSDPFCFTSEVPCLSFSFILFFPIESVKILFGLNVCLAFRFFQYVLVCWYIMQ